MLLGTLITLSIETHEGELYVVIRANGEAFGRSGPYASHEQASAAKREHRDKIDRMFPGTRTRPGPLN